MRICIELQCLLFRLNKKAFAPFFEKMNNINFAFTKKLSKYTFALAYSLVVIDATGLLKISPNTAESTHKDRNGKNGYYRGNCNGGG